MIFSTKVLLSKANVLQKNQFARNKDKIVVC